MPLYCVSFDDQNDYVEAANFTEAIAKWDKHIREDPDMADFDDEPDSCALISEEPVIR